MGGLILRTPTIRERKYSIWRTFLITYCFLLQITSLYTSLKEVLGRREETTLSSMVRWKPKISYSYWHYIWTFICMYLHGWDRNGISKTTRFLTFSVVQVCCRHFFFIWNHCPDKLVSFVTELNNYLWHNFTNQI